MRPRTQYEVNCHPGEGECLKLVNASCVVLGMGPLSALGADSGDDLEYILTNLNSVLAGLDSTATGNFKFTNIGNGAEVWAGVNNKLLGQFRTLRGGTGINIEETSTEIKIGVDTDWFHDAVEDILNQYGGMPMSTGYETIRLPEEEPAPKLMTMGLPQPPELEPTPEIQLMGVQEEELHDLETRINEQVNWLLGEVNSAVQYIDSKTSTANNKVDLKVKVLGREVEKVDTFTRTLDNEIREVDRGLVAIKTKVDSDSQVLSNLTQKTIPEVEIRTETLETELSTLKVKVNKEWNLKQKNSEVTLEGLVQSVKELQDTVTKQDRTIRRLRNQVQASSNIEMSVKDGILTLGYKGGVTFGSVNLCDVANNCKSTKPNWTVSGKVGTSSSRDSFTPSADGEYLYRELVDINEDSPTYGQNKWALASKV